MRTLMKTVVEVMDDIPDEACVMSYAVVWPYNPKINAPAGVAAMFRTEHDAEHFVESMPPQNLEVRKIVNA